MCRVLVRGLFLALLGGCAPGLVRAEGADPLAKLSGAEALVIAKALSSDAMKGRKTGFEGGRLADDYVAQAMGDIGLDPKDPGGAYLDAFEFQAAQVKAPIALAIGGQPLAYGTAYVDLVNSGGGRVEGDVVFVGYGISAPAQSFDEYAGMDVKGKIVMAVWGAPEGRAAEFPEQSLLGVKSALARERGAKAFLVCEGERAVVGTIPPKWFRADLPALWLSAKAADRLLAAAKTTLDAERTARDVAKTALKPVATGAKVALEVHVDHVPRAQGHNALGAIRGSDPDLRHEVVLVGAHMDHLGVDALGRVHNGADDNASGTAVLLHVARTLKDAGWQPKRMILFVAFGASDQGLVGSRHLAEGLPFEHDGIVCVLNVARVGVGAPGVLLEGARRFPKMGERLASYLPEGSRRMGPGAPSEGDDAPFADKGIPAFLLTSDGPRPHHRTVGDDAEHVKPECLEAAAKVLGALVVRLGSEPLPLTPATAEGAR